MKKLKQKGIIFDLDGTLWDSSKAVVDSWNEMLKDCDDIDYEMTIEKMQGYMGKPMDEIARAFFSTVTEERAMELLEMCCDYENAYIYEHGGILFDDVKETLEALHNVYHISIVSNCQQGYIEAFLQHHQLSYYVDDYLDFGTTGLEKGKNIQRMIKQNDLQQAWYVGDTLGDYEATKIAEIPFIFAEYGFGEVPQAEEKISSIKELLNRFQVEIKETEIQPFERYEKKKKDITKPKVRGNKLLCNPNSIAEAEQCYRMLRRRAGKMILTGQHTQTNAMEEREYIHAVTGCYPKVVGFEMLSYSGNINLQNASQECRVEVLENQRTMRTAMKIAKETQSIITICFHWFSPIGGKDKSFFAANTDFDCRKIFEDTEERVAFYRDLSVVARELEAFNKEHIPVLWRPFHEVEGDWFWWSAYGPEVAVKLYRLMYDYFVNVCHLNNLIWVWSCPSKEAYPGDDYVDIIGWDIYLKEKKHTDYAKELEELKANTSAKKVYALTEVGYLPDVEQLKKSNALWSYYMTWSKEYCIGEKYNTVEELRNMYHNEYSEKLK